MAKNRSALRAGILMIVSVALIICVVIGIKGLSWIKDRKTDYLVAFDLRTNSLTVNSRGFPRSKEAPTRSNLPP